MLRMPSSAKVEAQVKKDLEEGRRFAQLSEKIRGKLKDHFRGVKPLEVAPEAELFDMLDDKELDRLRESIHSNCACLSPLTVDTNGRLIDGRNRLKAMSTLSPQVESVLNRSTDPFHYVAVRKDDPTGKQHPHNIEFRVHVVDTKPESVASAVLSQNINRRHMTPAQKAAVIAKLTPAMDAKTQRKRAAQSRWKRDSCEGSNDPSHKTADELAKEAGVSAATIKRARKDHKADPKITEAVIAGDTKTAQELRAKVAKQPEAKRPLLEVAMANTRSRKSAIDLDTNKARDFADLYRVVYVKGKLRSGVQYFYFKCNALDRDVEGRALDDDLVVVDGVVDKDGDLDRAVRDAFYKHFPHGFCAVEREFTRESMNEIYQHRHGKQIKDGEGLDKHPEVAKLSLLNIVGKPVKVMAVKGGYVYVQRPGIKAVKPDGNIHLLRATKLKVRELLRMGNDNGIYTKARYAELEYERRKMGIESKPNVEERVKELRALMQQHHPDRGGDADEFIKAKKQYEALKARHSRVSIF
mgnify:CR=1 FL=1